MRRQKVLIVDDDRSIQFTVQEILDDAGIEMLSADSGRECLEKLRAGFRGVILLDVMMPEMDGWETLQTMREEGLLEGNVVCMLTAVQVPGPELSGLQGCVFDYICKPFTEEYLLTALAECFCHV